MKAPARLYAWLARQLERPSAPRRIIALSLLLMLPGLPTGLAADDYVHALMLQGSPQLEGFVRAPLDIFRFCGERFTPSLIRDGVFAWWDDPHARLAFFRPISALSHYLDHALWPTQPWLMHLHSLLWGALVLLGVRALYRELVPDRFVSTLALALYALDDARAWFVSWVAARNAVIATAFSVWALYAHHKQRRAGAWLLLLLALCSGEGAIATYAYLVGHALLLAHGRLSSRLLRLWPYAVLLLAWRVVYHALDYGVAGSSLYVDPLAEPRAFAARVLERGPVLLAAQLGGLWSDLWTSLFLAPRLRVVVYVASLAGSAVVLYLLVPAARREPLVRFGLFGALASIVPASAVFPADRLLTWTAIGACLALAHLLSPVLRGEPQPRLLSLCALGLVLSNLVLAPPLIASRARGNVALRDALDRAHAAIPRDASVARHSYVFVNPPAVPLASYLPIERAAQGLPLPRDQRLLATSTTEVAVLRLSQTTLRLTPRGGFLLNPASKLMWSPARTFRQGERIPYGDTRVVVTRVTADGRPAQIDVTFPSALEGGRYVFLQWLGAAYAPFTPPPVGGQVTLPAADYLQVIFGIPLPIAARY